MSLPVSNIMITILMPMSTFSSMDDKFVIIPDLDTGNNQIALTSEA